MINTTIFPSITSHNRYAVNHGTADSTNASPSYNLFSSNRARRETKRNSKINNKSLPNIASNRYSQYHHDIGRWALVKFCQFPLNTLHYDVKNIPNHIIQSLKN